MYCLYTREYETLKYVKVILRRGEERGKNNTEDEPKQYIWKCDKPSVQPIYTNENILKIYLIHLELTFAHSEK
jgi:hypothetical protein